MAVGIVDSRGRQRILDEFGSDAEFVASLREKLREENGDVRPPTILAGDERQLARFAIEATQPFGWDEAVESMDCLRGAPDELVGTFRQGLPETQDRIVAFFQRYGYVAQWAQVPPEDGGADGRVRLVIDGPPVTMQDLLRVQSPVTKGKGMHEPASVQPEIIPESTSDNTGRIASVVVFDERTCPAEVVVPAEARLEQGAHQLQDGTPVDRYVLREVMEITRTLEWLEADGPKRIGQLAGEIVDLAGVDSGLDRARVADVLRYLVQTNVLHGDRIGGRPMVAPFPFKSERKEGSSARRVASNNTPTRNEERSHYWTDQEIEIAHLIAAQVAEAAKSARRGQVPAVESRSLYRRLTPDLTARGIDEAGFRRLLQHLKAAQQIRLSARSTKHGGKVYHVSFVHNAQQRAWGDNETGARVSMSSVLRKLGK